MDALPAPSDCSPEGEREATLGLQPVFQALREAGRRGLALDQVVERAEADSALDQLLLVAVRQDDDRDGGGRGVGPQAFQHRQAVELRKPQVEKDDIGAKSTGL